MKTKLFITLLLVLGTMGLKAQGVKIGYTNTQYILTLMPEAKQIQSELTAYETQLRNQIQAKIQTFQEKAEAYQRDLPTMTEILRADKERELQALQTQIEQFQRDAEQSLQDKQIELFKPALEKIQNTINQVAEENGYTHIFSSDVGVSPVLLYVKEEDEFTPLVLAKLGITPPAAATDE